MIELIDKLNICKTMLQKHQPIDFTSTVVDMNVISFFNSKNIKTLQSLIVDPCNGSYKNLNYIVMLLTDMKTTEHSVHGSLFKALKNYIDLYTDAVNGTLDIETNLFLTKDGFENEELIYTAFALVLISKHRQ